MKKIALAFVLVSGFATTALADATPAADQTTAPVEEAEAAAE